MNDTKDTPMLTETLTNTEPVYQEAPKGLQTTQGQFTALFTLVALAIAAISGWNITGLQIESWLGTANTIATVLVPIIAGLLAVNNFTNSQGKVQSNTVKANALVEATRLAPMQAASLGDIPGLGQFLGGKNWKDPNRYINIVDLGSKLGIPGLTQADRIIDRISGQPAAGTIDPKENDPLLEALRALNARLDKLEQGKDN